ncbi:MAG TPA: hypothetical protein VF391_16490 [Dermatophilaceae bacterium]
MSSELRSSTPWQQLHDEPGGVLVGAEVEDVDVFEKLEGPYGHDIRV